MQNFQITTSLILAYTGLLGFGALVECAATVENVLIPTDCEILDSPFGPRAYISIWLLLTFSFTTFYICFASEQGAIIAQPWIRHSNQTPAFA